MAVMGQHWFLLTRRAPGQEWTIAADVGDETQAQALAVRESVPCRDGAAVLVRWSMCDGLHIVCGAGTWTGAELGMVAIPGDDGQLIVNMLARIHVPAK